MKKNSIGLLIILVLSIIVNANYVRASVTISGSKWDGLCIYKSDTDTIKLYYKSGDETLETILTDTYLSNGSDSELYIKNVHAKGNYELEKIELKDGTKHIVGNWVNTNERYGCPATIYRKTNEYTDSDGYRQTTYQETILHRTNEVKYKKTSEVKPQQLTESPRNDDSNTESGNIVANGEQWEKQCKYNSGDNTLTLYIKSGKTLIINKKIAQNNPGQNTGVYGNQTIVIKPVPSETHTLTSEIIVNDNKCPRKIYEYTTENISSSGYSSSYTYTYRTYEVKQNAWQKFWSPLKYNVYIRESGDPSIPDIDNTGSQGCDEVIDSTVKKLINKYLGYIHWIVPILIMALGTYDFFRAMLASKEDEMKKAQKRFIIRLVAGVLVFLAPTIVNIIIDVLNDVMTNPTCKV